MQQRILKEKWCSRFAYMILNVHSQRNMYVVILDVSRRRENAGLQTDL